MFTTTAKIANRDASGFISKVMPFQGSNLRAEWANVGEDHCYCIYSYSTMIAYLNPVNGDAWCSPEYYSQTTSRHMGLVRRGFDALESATR